MRTNLQDKVAVVTGSSSGDGRAIANGGKAEYVEADAADYAAVEGLVGSVDGGETLCRYSV
jgi:hypothetical protein